MVLISDGKTNEGISCPICGSKTVYASVLTVLSFIGKHYVYTDGLEFGSESMMDIIGEPAHEPMMKCTKFRCTACDKEWTNSFIKLRWDNEGICHFEECEEGYIDKLKQTKLKRRKN